MGSRTSVTVLVILAALVLPALTPLGLVPGASASIVTPAFTVYAAPTSLPNWNNAGEPSIGVNWNTGKVFFQAYTSTYRVNFSPATPTWTPATPPGSIINVDPILFTDSVTGRTFAGGLDGACSLLFYTDNDGGLWTPMPEACSGEGWDHETIGGGPFAAPVPGSLPSPAYAHAVYYCSQIGLTSGPSGCAMSADGGLTFTPGAPWALNCGGLHGHVKVGPDGWAYVPDSSCSGGQGVLVSNDNGLNWTTRVTPISATGQFDPSVAVGGNLTKQRLYFCGRDGSGHAKVAVSGNHGATWSSAVDVGASASIVNVEFPTMVAGDWDRAACAFLGTTSSGDTQSSGFGGVWHLYVAFTYDAGSTWSLVDATGSDPVQKGCIWAGGGSNTCRNLLDFMDATIDANGNVLVGFADGCTGSCATGGASNWASRATIARQTEGSPLFAAHDPTGVGVPLAPTLSAAGGNARVDLSWTTPSNNGSTITNYKIYRGTSSGSETLLATIGTNTTFSDLTVTNGVTYYYKVTAVNGVGEGDTSNEVSVTPNPGPPFAPTLTAIPSSGRVNLSWTTPYANGSAITNYKIYRGTTSGGESLLSTIGTNTSYADLTVTNNVTYYYQVKAVNSLGDGAASNEATATPGAMSVPSAPRNLTGWSAGAIPLAGFESATLTWSVPASNGNSTVTGYKVYRDEGSGFVYLAAAATTSYGDTTVTPGKTYVYEVTAVNGIGEGPASNAVTVTVNAPPSPPTIPTV